MRGDGPITGEDDACQPLISDLKLALYPRSLAATLRSFTLITRTPVLAPATLAALPSTRAIPDRDVFYVAHAVRSILTSDF
jgi:hypothetical protein